MKKHQSKSSALEFDRPLVRPGAHYVVALPKGWPDDGRTKIGGFDGHVVLIHPDRKPLVHKFAMQDYAYDTITLTTKEPGEVTHLNPDSDSRHPSDEERSVFWARVVGVAIILLWLAVLTSDLWLR